MELRLGRHTFAEDQPLMMAIVNRTRDSFYDRGATFDDAPARDRVEQVVSEGAEIIDIGGVRAGYGEQVDAVEEIRRVAPFVAWLRSAHPEVAISVDTWRSEVAREVCAAGADLLNDAWGGHDPGLVEVAAEFGAAVVCTHTVASSVPAWRSSGPSCRSVKPPRPGRSAAGCRRAWCAPRPAVRPGAPRRRGPQGRA